MTARHPLLAVAAVAGLIVAGCNDDDTPSAAEPVATTDAATEVGAVLPISGCQPVDESPDGVYRFEAGELTMSRDGDRLVLVEVRPGEGWTHRVDEQADNEIEVDFRREDREIDFEAELDGGLLDIEICADQGD